MWGREDAKKKEEEMAEEGLIALAPESDCPALPLTCYVTLTFSYRSFHFHHKMGITLFHRVVKQSQGNNVCKELSLCLIYTSPM